MQDKIYSIALVEDNEVNVKSFIEKLKAYSAHLKIEVYEGGQAFLKKIKLLPLEKYPDIVFMDLQMPGLNGVETIKLSKIHNDKMLFIAYTVFDDDQHIFEAIMAGAQGYLLKNEDGETIYKCIIDTLENQGSSMSPAIARKALRMLSQPVASTPVEENNFLQQVLTDREIEILQQLVKGYDAKKIAVIIDISTLTVRKHISNIYQKLHINSKAQVMSLANKEKWFK